MNEQWEPEQQRETNVLSSTRSTEKRPHERREGLAAGTPMGSFHSFPFLKGHVSGLYVLKLKETGMSVVWKFRCVVLRVLS